MKHLSPMINSAIEEDKEGFLDNFVKEFVDRVNEKVAAMHNGIKKNILQSEGVWNEPEEIEEEVIQEDSVLASKWDLLREHVNDYRFQTIEEAKRAMRKLQSAGICETCAKQVGNRIFLESLEDYDIVTSVYDALLEEMDELYIPFFELATNLKEAIRTGSVEMTLEDGTEVTIESEMAEDIARVHDTLTRENQISFRDEITLNEESFERMINFVNKAIQKLNSEEEQ